MEERDWEELEEEVREEPGEAEEERGSSGEEDPSLERSRFQGEGVLAYIFNNFAAWPLLTPEEERRLLALYLMSRKSLAPLAEALDLTPEEVEVGVRRRAMRDWGVPGEGEGGIAERDVPKELRKHYALVYQGEEARMRLVLSNARLVVSIAKKYAQKWPSVPMEDIIQEGFNGLFKAIDRFDLKLANKLSTYASWWIRDAVEKGVRRYLFVHRTDTEEGSKEYFVLSLDERVVEGEEDRYADLLPAPQVEPEEGEGNLARKTLAVLSLLPPREAFILANLYGLAGVPKTGYGELAKKLGVTETRVRQLEKRAVEMASKMVGGTPPWEEKEEK